MSVTQMGLVWEHSWGKGEQLVMLALTDHADHEGGSIYPSLDLVAWKTGYHQRHVQRIVRGLRERGILEIVREADPHGRPTEYRINWARATKKAPRGRRTSEETRRRWRDALVEELNATCSWCGEAGTNDTGPDGQPWHLDRIIPGARGGKYTRDNVTLSCGTCNRSHKDRPKPHEAPTLADFRGEGCQDGTPRQDGTPPGATQSTPGGATQSTRGVPQVAPEPSVNRHTNHQREEDPAAREAYSSEERAFAVMTGRPDPERTHLTAQEFFRREVSSDFRRRYVADLRRWFDEHGPDGIRELIPRARELAQAENKNWYWVLSDLLNGTRTAESGEDVLERIKARRAEIRAEFGVDRLLQDVN